MENKLSALLAIDDNVSVYQDLKKIYQRQKGADVVPFFGAGISYGIYPQWISLLEELARTLGSGYVVDSSDNFREIVKREGSEKIASMLKDNSTTGLFLERVVKQFNPDKLRSMDILFSGWRSAVPEVFQGPILTTNYDKTIETLYQGRIKRYIVNNDGKFDGSMMAEDGLSRNLSLFKLHGCVDAPRSIVLDIKDYDKAYREDSQVVECLRDYLKHSYLLFIGCSLEEDRTIDIMRKVYGKEDIHHFAFVELPKETENPDDPYRPLLTNKYNRFLPELKRRKEHLNSEYGLRCVWFPYDKFDDIYVLLQGLKVDCEESSNLIGRENELKTLAGELLKSNVDKLILLHGVNGSGKTALCEHLANCGFRFYNVKCETVSTYNGLLSTLVKAFHCSDDVREPEKIVLSKISEFSGLGTKDKPVILYLDNLDSLLRNQECTEFENFVQRVYTNRYVRLLATTAFWDVGNINSYAKPVPLDDLNYVDASKLFTKLWNESHCNQTEKFVTPEQVTGFVKSELGNHAMTIELCCSYSTGFSFDGFVKHWYQEVTHIFVGEEYTPFRRSFNKLWEFLCQHKLHQEFLIIWHIFYYTSSSLQEDELYRIIGDDSNRWRQAVRELVHSRIITRDDRVLYMKSIFKYQLSYSQYKDKEMIIRYSLMVSKMLLNYYLNIQNNMSNDWALFIKKLRDVLFYMSIISTYNEPEFIDHIREIYFLCRYHYHHTTLAARVFLEQVYQNLEHKTGVTDVSDLLSDIRFRIGQLKFYLCDNRGALADYDKAAKLRDNLDEKSKAVYDLYRSEILMYESATMQVGKELLKSAYNSLQSYDCIDTARVRRLYVSKIMKPEMRKQAKNRWTKKEITQYYQVGERELAEAEAICKREKNYFELCYVLRNWGEWLILCREYFPENEQNFIEIANERYRESQVYANRYSFKYAIAHVMMANGEVYKIKHRLELALVEYENAYSKYEELCEYQGQGHALKAQADIYTDWYQKGNVSCYWTADKMYTDAIDLYEKAKDDRARGFGFFHRAVLKGKTYKMDAIRDAHIAINIFRTGQLHEDEGKVKKWVENIEDEK